MDPRQFDALSRTLAGDVSRRRAMARFGAAGVLAGLVGALGRERPLAALPRAQGETCQLAIVANIRVGPSADALLQGEEPGELRGDLSFTLGRDGAIDSGRLRLGGGQELPVVGQATGRAIDLRVEAGIGQTLVFTGTAQQPLPRCQGAVDGLFTGPRAGDLGDWHASATALGAAPAQGGGTAPTATQGASAPTATSAAAATATATSVPGATATATPAATATGTPTATPPATATATPTETPTPEGPTPTATPLPLICPTGTTDCGGVCVNTQTDPANCGACGNACASGEFCLNGGCFPVFVACISPEVPCGDVCVDLQTDPDNCGACGNACGFLENCFLGLCVPPAVGQ